jgi:hypothetical protein
MPRGRHTLIESKRAIIYFRNATRLKLPRIIVTPVRQACRGCQGPMLVLRTTDLCRVAPWIDASTVAKAIADL